MGHQLFSGSHLTKGHKSIQSLIQSSSESLEQSLSKTLIDTTASFLFQWLSTTTNFTLYTHFSTNICFIIFHFQLSQSLKFQTYSYGDTHPLAIALKSIFNGQFHSIGLAFIDIFKLLLSSTTLITVVTSASNHFESSHLVFTV